MNRQQAEAVMRAAWGFHAGEVGLAETSPAARAAWLASGGPHWISHMYPPDREKNNRQCAFHLRALADALEEGSDDA